MFLKEYSKALHYVRAFLQIEPGNTQVQRLEVLIKKKMDRGNVVLIVIVPNKNIRI